MSGSVQLNGARVTSATITIPIYGAWSADVEIEGTTAISPKVTLVIGGLSLVGTVIRQAAFAGARKVRIVGGAAGWRKQIAARGYSLPSGVRASVIIADAASESGETIGATLTNVVGNFFVRRKVKAERVLKLLANNVWYIDAAGVTQVQERPTSRIVSPFTVTKWDGGRGIFEIATETYQDWVPGRTFTTNTVPDAQTISSVTIDADNEGRVRLTVMTADATRERLLSDFRAIVRSEISSLAYYGVYEYVIAPSPLSPGLVFTVDGNPTDPNMPPLTRVPLANGVGKLSPPVAGTKCRVRFVNADPARPEVISFDGSTEHLLTVEAFTVLMHNIAFGLAAAGLPPAWLGTGIIPGIINAAITAAAAPGGAGVVAQTIAAAAAAASMVSAPGNSSTLYNGTIATALTAKLPDVSGFFPGVGVP